MWRSLRCWFNALREDCANILWLFYDGISTHRSIGLGGGGEESTITCWTRGDAGGWGGGASPRTKPDPDILQLQACQVGVDHSVGAPSLIFARAPGGGVGVPRPEK